VQIRRIRYNLCGHNTSLNIVCVATLGGGSEGGREGGMEGGRERARESRGRNIFTNSYSSAAFHRVNTLHLIKFRFDSTCNSHALVRVR
jgi:hypothetical protein